MTLTDAQLGRIARHLVGWSADTVIAHLQLGDLAAALEYAVDYGTPELQRAIRDVSEEVADAAAQVVRGAMLLRLLSERREAVSTEMVAELKQIADRLDAIRVGLETP